ncbi:hypothetical protein [uncultured Thomasclavelia sp.]|uniref:hypothetical protein n=1 Tax=uncultured Thomasclavelia sp. TaxID=3025759 RepID=UPI00261ACD2F|nr:hypothetical protein [uncultured Thomasclavelia sp.]
MSEDLRQYFTDEIVDTSDNEIITMLQIILGYQENADDLIDYLEESIDMVADVIQEETADIEFLNTHLFFDVLNEDIYTKIFSSFLKYEDFDLEIISDNVIWELYNYEKEKFDHIENEFPLQVRKHAKEFYDKAKNECYYHEKFDDSIAESICFRAFRLNIKNKKIARKLRKNYEQKGWFYQLCYELGFYMENGQFLYMAYGYLDGCGFYENYINSVLVQDAIKELNVFLNTGRKINPGIDYVLEEATLYYGFNDTIMTMILNLMNTKEEVII